MPDTTLELRNAAQSRKDELVYNLFGETGKPGMIRNVKQLSEFSSFSGNAFSLKGTTYLSKKQWNNAFKFIFVSSSLPFIEVKTSTNYARVLRWDGTLGPVVTGANGIILLESNVMTFTTPNYGTSIASPYNTNIPKFAAILPCASNGAFNDLYKITKILISSYSASNITEIILPEGDSLTYFDGGMNSVQNFDFSKTIASEIELRGGGGGDTAVKSLIVNKQTLTSLAVIGSELEYLDLSNCPLLTNVDVFGGNKLVSLDLSNCPSLTSVNCSSCKLSYLNLKGCSSLQGLSAGSNSLTSLDLSDCLNLSSVDVTVNNMSSFEHDNMYNSLQAPPPWDGFFASSGQLGNVTSASADKRAALVAGGWYVETA